NPTMSTSARADIELEDPRLRAYLRRYLRRRMPAADADDAVQAVYCAALEARARPRDEEGLRRWLTVIARRKVAAYYERSSLELAMALAAVAALAWWWSRPDRTVHRVPSAAVMPTIAASPSPVVTAAPPPPPIETPKPKPRTPSTAGTSTAH